MNDVEIIFIIELMLIKNYVAYAVKSVIQWIWNQTDMCMSYRKRVGRHIFMFITD